MSVAYVVVIAAVVMTVQVCLTEPQRQIIVKHVITMTLTTVYRIVLEYGVEIPG
jgi:hypothetical protein